MIKKAMILAAGFGKRLRPLTLETPKPLVELAGKPLLQHALDRLAARQPDTIVINTHYLAEKITAYVQPLKDLPIILSHEQDTLETGGGIAKALPYFKNQPFFCLNSDIWWQETSGSSLDQLEQNWDETTMDALLLLVHRDNAQDYQGQGDFFWDPATLIPRFRQPETSAPYIYTGVQILHPRLFESCPTGSFSIVELYHRAYRNNRLKAIVLDGTWSDLGTIQALESLRDRLENE